MGSNKIWNLHNQIGGLYKIQYYKQIDHIICIDERKLTNYDHETMYLGESAGCDNIKMGPRGK